MPQNRAPHSARHSWLPQIAAHWAPHTLSEVQQWKRYAIAQDLLNRYQREGDDFLGRIITLDETWTCSYEPHLMRQSNEWKHPGSPRPKKVRPTQSNVKAMFIVTYDTDGVILHHTVPQRQTVNVATTAISSVIIFVQHSGESDSTCWQRVPSSFMTMLGLILPTLSRISFAAGDGRYWNNRHTHPI